MGLVNLLVDSYEVGYEISCCEGEYVYTPFISYFSIIVHDLTMDCNAIAGGK
jgi:hypothetical protein